QQLDSRVPNHPHGSSKANFSYAILEVFCASHNFDFDAHEVDRQVAAIQFRETNGILLCRDNHFGLAFLTAVNDIKNFLLLEAMMICKALPVNQIGTELHEALLKALRKRDATEGRHLLALKERKFESLAGKNILQIQRMVLAFNNRRSGI